MNMKPSTFALFSAALLSFAPAFALDRAPDWEATAKETQGKAAAILSDRSEASAAAGKAVSKPAAASSKNSEDWCAREFAKNAANAKEITDLLVAGKIEEPTHGLLLKMNENAFRSVELTCEALAGKGEKISKAESDRRWCAGERAKVAENSAEISRLHAEGKISPESRELLDRMTENAGKSVEMTCRAPVRP